MKAVMKRFGIIGLIFALFLLASCSSKEEKKETTGSEDAFLTFNDALDREVVLKEKPERIVILNTAFLGILYELGGEAVGRATFHATPIPKEAEDVPELGSLTNINVEKLISLEPDLVIGMKEFHGELEDVLASNDIPLAMLTMTGFDEVEEMSELFGKITGNEEKAAELLEDAKAKIATIQDKIADLEKPKIAIISVTPDIVYIQRTETTPLEMTETLGFENVAFDLEPEERRPTTAPYSVEKLVELQPDYIFITVHGSTEVGERMIREELESSPAWNSLNAVKSGNLHVLPTELFLVNPVYDYDEPLEYLAEIVYPEVFTSDNE